MVDLLTDCKWITLFVIVVVMKKPMGVMWPLSVRLLLCPLHCLPETMQGRPCSLLFSPDGGEKALCTGAPVCHTLHRGGGRRGNAHSHSIVEGGLEEMS